MQHYFNLAVSLDYYNRVHRLETELVFLRESTPAQSIFYEHTKRFK